jgi:hypothetical protein
MEEQDPNIGEVFEDSDWRMSGRRVKVLSAFDKRAPMGGYYTAYRVETVLSPSNPSAVGNKSSIGAEALKKRFRKVSH